MKFSVYYALAALSVPASLIPVSAHAQDTSCSCTTAYQGPSSPVGTVLSSVGNVMILQPAGYVDAVQGSELPLGGRVVTGARSSAAVTVGQGCRLDLAENSNLDVSLVGDNVCVKIQKETTSTSVVTRQGAYAQLNGRRILTPATLFGGLALGAGILSATTHDEERAVSR